MKDSNAQGALRKTRKQIKKTFTDPDEKDDIDQLHNLLSDIRLKALTSLFDRLKSAQPDPEDKELLANVQSSLSELYAIADANDEAAELCDILSSLHVRSFVEAYDNIAKKNFVPDIPPIKKPGAVTMPGAVTPEIPAIGAVDANEPPSPSDVSGPVFNGSGVSPPLYHPLEGAMKMVGFRKEPGEDMGVTVTVVNYYSAQYGQINDIVVERIMSGSQIEQQDVLHPGDVIREVNGIPIDSPETLQKILRKASGIITFKIIPAQREKNVTSQLYMRAHFSYDASFDRLIPCKEAGLHFNAGDVLQILNQDDPHWWQARLYGSETRAGLVPSVTLEERRKAFNQSAPDPDEITYKMFGCGLGRRKKKVKITFKAREAEEYENTDVVVYEEVAMMNGFSRPVICFLGAPGVGRRTLKEMILKSDPDRYASALPHTSRSMRPSEVSGERYFFASYSEMQADIMNNRYIEVGENNENLYGTKIDTIRSICKSGKTCLLDCSPAALKLIRTAEFMPYVVFIACPSVDCMKAMYEYGRSMGLTEKWKRDEDFRQSVDESMEMERKYRHLFDYIIVNDNMAVTFDCLREQLDSLVTEPQWLPAKWLY